MRIRPWTVVRLLALGATLLGALWLGSVAQNNPAIQNLIMGGGYIGVFVFSVINGFNVVVPIVTPSFIPALSAAGLDIYALIAIIALGMTIADCVAYFLARAGHMHLTRTEERLTRSLKAAEARKHWLPLVVLGVWSFVVPLPNEIAVVPLGLLGYPPRHVIPILIVGNIAFTALAGFGFVDIVGAFQVIL